jgi:hypothetical protein
MGQVWRVGPHQQYKKPSDVASLVQDGDVVEIEAAHYACDTGVKWVANNLTLIAVGGRASLDATHCTVLGDKGIWNPQGKNLIVDNIEFIGAVGPSRNDAGIRYDGSGYLYITNSYFHDNENGILITPSDGPATNIVVDHCEFAHNGAGDGQSHNMYISAAAGAPTSSFVIRFSYSHEAHVGHEVKTRALTNYILYNRISDEQDGDSSYDIDVPQGGLTYIIGNIIQHGPHAQNSAMVSYSAEGTHNPVQEIYLVNNSLVSEVPQKHGVALNLYDHGLTTAKMINNLVVGVSSVVGVTPDKMALVNNIVTDAPGFYDQASRNYYLTADSPAIHAGVDPGTAHGVPLAPAFQFHFPAGGEPRSTASAIDAGAFQYQAGQAIPQPPSIRLNASSAVDYNAPVTLTWSATNATYCTARGDWSGSVALSGTYTSPPLTAHRSYGISCIGAGGSVSRSVSVDVNQSPEATALGAYEWRKIPDSALKSVCAPLMKNSSGAFIYEDNFGSGPNCESKGVDSTGVYVPQTHTWYLLGGGAGRSYYGNEVYGFDIETEKPLLVTVPDHIRDSKEYVPSDAANSKIHVPGCSSVLHREGGETFPAATGIHGTAAWIPQLKQIVVGPGTFVRGSQGCSVRTKEGVEVGQMTTSIWGFSPPPSSQIPASSSAVWHLLAPEDNAFGSVSTPIWLMDPATALIYVAGDRAYSDRGGFLVAPTQLPPKHVLVNATWPYGLDVNGADAVDTDAHYAMIIGNGRLVMWNLNGLSISKYSPNEPFIRDKDWQINGATDLLGDPHHVGLTYNSKLKAFVAWTGGAAVYFLYPEYGSKTIRIVAKMDVAAGPAYDGDLDGKFVYLPGKDSYLAFTGMDSDFYFLVPPPDAKSAATKRPAISPSGLAK